MDNEATVLAELMLSAEQLCAILENPQENRLTNADAEELRLKLGQARNAVARLQSRFDQDELKIVGKSVQAEFRLIIVTLSWAVYYCRQTIDRAAYRRFVSIQSGLIGVLTNNAGFGDW
jgi:hypothetical protein